MTTVFTLFGYDFRCFCSIVQFKMMSRNITKYYILVIFVSFLVQFEVSGSVTATFER